jgi:subtilisin family serine protease
MNAERRGDSIVTFSQRLNIIRRTGLLAAMLALAAGAAFAEDRGRTITRKFDRAVSEARQGSRPLGVILRVVPGREKDVRAALKARNRRIDDEMPSVAGMRTVLSPEDIDLLAGMDAVAGISADAVIHATGAGNKTSSKTSDSTTSSTTSPTDLTSFFGDLAVSWPQWNALMGSLGVQYSGRTGAGVGVAIVDSGIDGTATEFAGRISAFYDFTTKAGRSGKTSTPTDAYGHGTHVAGLIGASSLTFGGIAPRVHFVGVKVLDATGAGQTSHAVKALEFLTTNRRALNIHIVNLSLGHPILEPAATDPLVQAVEKAVAAGLVVVTSAGNYGQNPTTGISGYAGITSPGNAPSAITVGSLDVRGTANRRDDTASVFSSRGPTWYDGFAKPDVLAPGHGLFSTTADGSELSKTASLTSASGSAVSSTAPAWRPPRPPVSSRCCSKRTVWRSRRPVATCRPTP